VGKSFAVSVVLTTYNRCTQLRRALHALCVQTGGVDYEVIVVDNNSTDGTRAVVDAAAARYHFVRYLFEPRQGLPYGRNTGVLAAAAPLVAFTDDDVEVGPEWVATVQRIFDSHPDVDMIGGRVRPVWPANVPPWVTPRQLGPFALGERGDSPVRVSAANAAPCLVGANFAFRRDVFRRVGLFDPAYTKSQDREIQLRLWRAGGVGLYAPELSISVVVPEDRLTKKYFRYWYRTYGVYHSRMRLLDTIDRDGRLMEPTGSMLLGAPGFLYRQLAGAFAAWLMSMMRFDTTSAFHWENRARYLWSYLRERMRGRGMGAATAPPLADLS
jgi:glycosyltransferase involved in cell wall biosynthesis